MKKVAQFHVIVTLFGVLFLATADNSVLIALLPLLSQDLGASIETLGWLFSGYALAAAVFNVLVGPLTDRFGRLPFLRLGLAAFALLGTGAFLSRSFSELLAVRAATGLAAGLLSTCVASLVGDLFPYRERGRAMGAVLSAYFAALILGVPLGVWVAGEWGWRSVFLGECVLALILLIRSLVGFPSETIRRDARPRAIFHAYPGFLRRREALGALAASFAVSGATLAFLTYLSGLGLSPGQISTLLLISGLAAVAGSPLSGWLSDRLTKRAVFLGANTALAAPLLLLDRIPWGPALGAVFFFASLLVAARQTALQTIQTELIPDRRRGAFIGLRNGFSQLGISSSVFAAGQFFGVYGYRGVAVFSAALTVAGSAIFYFSVSEPEPDASAETNQGER